MILRIYHNGKFDGAINMNRITSIVVNEYVLHKKTHVGDGTVLLYEKNAEIAHIGLHPETEKRLIDLENENKYHKINEIIREIAEEISWEWGNGETTACDINIADKYEKGYDII